jgi:hypothetical protein
VPEIPRIGNPTVSYGKLRSVTVTRPPNLLGCRYKISWAQHHFDDLKTNIDDFFTRNKYVVIVERGGGGHERFVARVKNPPEMPWIPWSLMIGDCVHNLRSALDYLVWELAGADPKDIHTMFPIYTNPTKYAQGARTRIARLPAEVQVLIEKLQPYNSAPTEELANKSALAALNRLNNADKHQLLTFIAAMPNAGNIVFTIPERAPKPQHRIQAFDVPLEHDAIVAELTFENDMTPKTNMKAEVVPNVAFGESVGFGRRMAVLSLRTIIEQVTMIVQVFKNQFNIAES